MFCVSLFGNVAFRYSEFFFSEQRLGNLCERDKWRVGREMDVEIIGRVAVVLRDVFLNYTLQICGGVRGCACVW